MLAVVEHDEEVTGLEDLDEALERRTVLAALDVERGEDRVRRQRGLPDRGEIADPHTIRVATGAHLGEAQRESRLPHATGSDECEHSRVLQQRRQLGHVVLASEQCGQRQR
jgi:hypothetical protein